MHNKTVAIGAALFLVLLVSAGFFDEVYFASGGINPIAAIAAIAVALVGFVWLKKTAKSTV